MNNLIKFGLIGAGAYMLWQKFAASEAPAGTGPAVAPGQPAYPPPTLLPVPAVHPQALPGYVPTPEPGTVAAAQASTTRDLVLAAARRAMPASWDSLLSAHQWNFFYQSSRGIPGPDPDVVWPGRDHANYRMSVDEWWAGVSANGLSGLSNYAMLRRGYVPAWTR